MRKSLVSFAGVFAVVVLAAVAQGADLIVSIVISPSTINLQSNGVWVTVHADIPYSTVDTKTATVTLDGIVARATFADNCGDLVAKFAVDEVRDILNPGPATLTLAGWTVDGNSFSGTDAVMVTDGGKKDQGSGSSR